MSALLKSLSKSFLKTLWKKERNTVKPAYSSFATMFSTFLKSNCNFLAAFTYILPSANAFSLAGWLYWCLMPL